MDERVKQLKTPEGCERFIANVIEKYPDLAKEARRRKIELLASAYGAHSAAEREALQAIYAYEEVVLFARNGKKTRASRTWLLVKNHGIIGAAEKAVNRTDDPSGFKALCEVDMLDLSFEAIVLRYPAIFSQKAVARSRQRLEENKLGLLNYYLR
jgi:hypothetical protein